MSSSLHRSALARLFLVTVLLGLSGCGDAESPLAPMDDTDPGASTALDPLVAIEPAALTGGQRILFSSARSGVLDLYKTDPQGGAAVRFTSYADWEVESAWSRDNSRVAMVRPRKDATGQVHDDIYIINADGTNGHWARATPLPYHLRYPSWHPDGTRLLVTIMQLGRPYIGRLNLATGKVSFVTSGGAGIPGGEAAYFPSGGKIVYAGPTGTVDQVNADGTGHKVLYSGTTYVGSPEISPDGKKLAFQKVFGGDIDLCLVNLVDGTKLRLTMNQGSNFTPSWSPDGSRLAFASNRTGVSQIYTMDAKGGTLKRISFSNLHEKDPSWSH